MSMISFILAIVLNLNMSTELEKPKLIYVGDPMCSWCYGISEELNKTVTHYEGEVDLEIVMGGLRAGGGEEWNESFKEFLRHHWEDVGMKSGQPFKFDLFDKPQFDYDTEPSCRAVVAVESIDANKMLPFFKAVQYGFYVENRDPKRAEFYSSICSELDIDFALFSKLFESSEMKDRTVEHFQRSADLGARSFPTVLLKYKGQIHKIAIGYSTYEKMKERVDAVING